jgi:hypothetical protein
MKSERFKLSLRSSCLVGPTSRGGQVDGGGVFVTIRFVPTRSSQHHVNLRNNSVHCSDEAVCKRNVSLFLLLQRATRTFQSPHLNLIYGMKQQPANFLARRAVLLKFRVAFQYVTPKKLLDGCPTNKSTLFG